MMNDAENLVEKCLDFAYTEPGLQGRGNIVEEGTKDSNVSPFANRSRSELAQLPRNDSRYAQLSGSEAYGRGSENLSESKIQREYRCAGSKAIVDELGKLFKQGGSDNIEPKSKIT